MVKRGEFVVGFRGGKMGHSLDIYFLTGFGLVDVSCGDSGMGVGAWGVAFQTSNGVEQATAKYRDPSLRSRMTTKNRQWQRQLQPQLRIRGSFASL
jgi:hypothetical protein